MDKTKLKKIIIKASSLEQGKELAIAKELISLDDKIYSISEKTDKLAEEVDVSLSGIKEELKTSYEVDEDKICESVLSKIEAPKDGENGKDYILTEKDKKEIASSIKVPVIEKVIEKTEVIHETPIITNEIKEVAITETPEEIKNKLETLKGEDRLDASAIKNLPKGGVFGRKGIPEAPIDGNEYARKDGDWVEVTGGGGGVTNAYAEVPTGDVDGVNDTYTLVNTPADKDGVVVLLNGVTQYNGIDYTVTGDTITFITPPANGSTIFAYYNTFTAGGVDTLEQSFETVSKNLKAYPATLSYTGDNLTEIVYTLPSGIITKTLNYTGDNLTSVVLSGDTPLNITLTKTLGYTGDNLTSITYS